MPSILLSFIHRLFPGSLFNAAQPILAEAQDTVADNSNWPTWFRYEFNGNEIWRFALLLLTILVTLIVGRLARFFIDRAAARIEEKQGIQLIELFLKCLARPVSVAVFAVGFYLSRLTLKFATETTDVGFSADIHETWLRVSQAVIALATAYFIYRLVDIVEYYLLRWTSKTHTTLDDMLVPVVRKTLRIFIVAVSVLFVADNILGFELGSILAAAGIGGLAIALAAKDTIANFFGSVSIFADRPFQVGERIRLGEFDGPVEEVGFRSTRIRTLNGHLVSVPNSVVASEKIENIGRRPFIKRVSNITITYDTPPDKVEKALQIIKDILAATEEVNHDPELPFRVFFNEFNDCSLNILMIYWVIPPDYWLFQQVSERVNLAMMRAFEAEGIEFAFPTQTLYLKKDD